MGRILIVGADTDSVRTVTQAVGKAHEVFTVPDRLSAERFVRAIPLDLVIGDAENPDIGWRQIRDGLRGLTSPAPLPFLFLTAEHDDAGMADLLAGDLVVAVRKPPGAHVVGIIATLIEGTARREGALGDDSLAKLIQHIAAHAESGLLNVYRGPIAKQLAIATGRVTDCQSNDPRDQLNMWILELGLATDEEVQAALREAKGASSLVSELLGLTGDQLAAVQHQRLREAMLDLYLWRIGQWSFFPIRQEKVGEGVDLNKIVKEGERRIARWDSLQRLFTNDGEVFRWAGTLPEDQTLEGGDRRLLDLIRDGKTFGQLLIQFRGRDYALRERLCGLFERGLIERDNEAVPTEKTEWNAPAIDPFDAVRRKGDVHTAADVQTTISQDEPDSAIETVLQIAEEHLDNGDVQAALECYQDVLRIDPTNTRAMLALAELDEITTHNAAKAGIRPDATVRLARPLEELLADSNPLPASEAFLLSRLVGGAMLIRDLMTILPITETETLEIIQRYVDSGVLEVS